MFYLQLINICVSQTQLERNHPIKSSERWRKIVIGKTMLKQQSINSGLNLQINLQNRWFVVSIIQETRDLSWRCAEAYPLAIKIWQYCPYWNPVGCKIQSHPISTSVVNSVFSLLAYQANLPFPYF